MVDDTSKAKLRESIIKATKKMFTIWERSDILQESPQETLEASQSLDELIKREFDNSEEYIKIKKITENRIRVRKDLGEIIIGNTILKKVKIIDTYSGYTRDLTSIAYYQLLPKMDAEKPLSQILQWNLSHHPCWVIWFTSPVFKGLKSRTIGEFIVAYSLTEKESDNYDLLAKLRHFACFGTSRGIDILLSFNTLKEAINFVEQFLPTIIQRNLYSDPEFLQFLRNYEQKEIITLLKR
jgi:hypothetical protein